MRLGDAYVDGEIAVDGPIEEILRVRIALAERLGKSPVFRRASWLAQVLPCRHSRRKDLADVGYHYDVGNDFYGLWLDNNMIYSCAYCRADEFGSALRQDANGRGGRDQEAGRNF